MISAFAQSFSWFCKVPSIRQYLFCPCGVSIILGNQTDEVRSVFFEIEPEFSQLLQERVMGLVPLTIVEDLHLFAHDEVNVHCSPAN